MTSRNVSTRERVLWTVGFLALCVVVGGAGALVVELLTKASNR